MFTIDYETKGITDNPIWLPPRPVGVAIKHNDEPGRYYGWGHPTGNNSTEAEANKALHRAYVSGEPLLFHNAPFDTSIAAKYHGFRLEDPLRIMDTQYSIFLTDPYAASFSLKPSATRILGLPPDERDVVKDWILANVRPKKPSEWGAYISEAPGDLVGPYAVGDVDRTYGIHQKLHGLIVENGMFAAYRREQELMPILTASSRRGIRVDRERLEADHEASIKLLGKVDKWFWKRVGYEFDVGNDGELANALRESGIVTEFVKTPTGRDSVSRKNLASCIDDPEFLEKLNYRGALETTINTFMRPWLDFSSQDGRLHTEWNQVRGDKSTKDLAGARTGRMSSMRPNFQNVPTEFSYAPKNWPALPMMRQYLLPEEGHAWLKRDFSAQEMRIAAHFEDGKFMQAFCDDPDMDPHLFVQGEIKRILSRDMVRKHVKITGFQILYGGGKNAISGGIGCTLEEAADLKNTYFAAMPGLKTLTQTVSNRGRRGEAIRTWGGRLYYKEPDVIKGNQRMDFSYKLPNYLIQGSAADQTKQSVIDWQAEAAPEQYLLAAVHDEINISAPIADVNPAMVTLRTAMNADRFDVPMRSEGFKGTTWQDIESWEP